MRVEALDRGAACGKCRRAGFAGAPPYRTRGPHDYHISARRRCHSEERVRFLQ
jgi:hypothetical protein